MTPYFPHDHIMIVDTQGLSGRGLHIGRQGVVWAIHNDGRYVIRFGDYMAAVRLHNLDCEAWHMSQQDFMAKIGGGVPITAYGLVQYEAMPPHARAVYDRRQAQRLERIARAYAYYEHEVIRAFVRGRFSLDNCHPDTRTVVDAHESAAVQRHAAYALQKALENNRLTDPHALHSGDSLYYIPWGERGTVLAVTAESVEVCWARGGTSIVALQHCQRDTPQQVMESVHGRLRDRYNWNL